MTPRYKTKLQKTVVGLKILHMIDMDTRLDSFLSLKVALEAEEAHAEDLREPKSRYVLCFISQLISIYFSRTNLMCEIYSLLALQINADAIIYCHL